MRGEGRALLCRSSLLSVLRDALGCAGCASGREGARTALPSARCCRCAVWDAGARAPGSSTRRGAGLTAPASTQSTPQRARRRRCRTCWAEPWGTGTLCCLSRTAGLAAAHRRSTSHQPRRLGPGEHWDGKHARKVTFPVQVRYKRIFTQSITRRLMKLTFERDSSTCTQSELSSPRVGEPSGISAAGSNRCWIQIAPAKKPLDYRLQILCWLQRIS